MAIDRGKYICQSQSYHQLSIESYIYKLTSMHQTNFTKRIKNRYLLFNLYTIIFSINLQLNKKRFENKYPIIIPFFS